MFQRLPGDAEARETLIVHNLRLVVYIARKFESTGIGVEDLISIGTIGLIKAVNTFCPDRNIKLATYASRCIENEILMYLRKTQSQKNEISIDEPLNIDWDGNELLLSDILGTDSDTVNRNETTAGSGGKTRRAGTRHHGTSVWFRRKERTYAKRGSGYHWDFTVLYFPTGEKDYEMAESRIGKNGGIMGKLQ